MTLVDLAHGKQRHVPYRDSRLTFLLQDSLGGNSKTMIIANVSPSICSANETLSSLKFAQRAKLIQNNAKVNEDASGDVIALQRQIQQLKGQLSFLMELHNPPYSLLEGPRAFEISALSDSLEKYDHLGERLPNDSEKGSSSHNKKSFKLSAINSASSLRRERNKEMELEALKAEIKHMNFLLHEKEEDAQRANTMLKLREEKIERLEMLLNGKFSAEKYLMEENNSLVEEIQLLQERIDSNLESTQLALENNRLIQELQLYHNFYGQGEREKLLAEISNLRNQLLEVLEGNATIYQDIGTQELEDLQECQNMNFKLIREVEELQMELQKDLRCSQGTSLEILSIGGGSACEKASFTQADEDGLQNEVSQSYSRSIDKRHSQIEKDLMAAKDFIEAMEDEQFRLVKQLEHIQEENDRLKAMIQKTDCVERKSSYVHGNESLELVAVGKRSTGIMNEDEESERKDLKARLHRILHELEEVTSLNNQYEQERASQQSHQKQVELVCEQVEMETSRTILQLQEEVVALQVELHDKLSVTNNENSRLREAIAAQQEEMRTLSADWENATLELTNFLLDGSRSLKDVSRQIASITGSFPQSNACIGEYVERAAIACIEKEETILQLQRSLEDAQKAVLEMEQKLGSLKGATIALSQFHHLTNEESSRNTFDLNMQLHENRGIIKMLSDRITEAEKLVYAAFLVIKWLSNHHGVSQAENIHGNTERVVLPTLVHSSESRSQTIPQVQAKADALLLEQPSQVMMASKGESSSKKANDEYHGGTEIFISAPQANVTRCGDLVQDMKKEVSDTTMQFEELRRNCGAPESSIWKDRSFVKIENGSLVLHQINDELRETNFRLVALKSCMDKKFGRKYVDDDFIDPYEWSGSCSTSVSESSDSDNIDTECELSNSSNACSSMSDSVTELKDSELQSQRYSESHNPEKGLHKPLPSPFSTDTTMSFRKELEDAFNMFNKQYIQFATLLHGSDIGASPSCKDINSKVVHFDQRLKTEAWGRIDGKEVADEKLKNANSFLTGLEETSNIIDEANLVLNELTKANENAKYVTSTWRQTGEALTVERNSLLEEVEHLKSSLSLKDKENELLKDTLCHAFTEIEDSLSSLEGYFKQIQRDVDGMLKAVHADVLSMRHDLLCSLHNSKSSVEDLYSEIMEKSFAVFVMYHCHVEHIVSKFSLFSLELGCRPFQNQRRHRKSQYTICSKDHSVDEEGMEDRAQSELLRKFDGIGVNLHHDELRVENSILAKELERKEFLLKGLLFDFRLLQESASNTKMKLDEAEMLLLSLSAVQKELDTKTSQLDEVMVLHRDLEDRLAGTERDLNISVSDLKHANEAIDILSEQNVELRALMKDQYLKKCAVEEQLNEQKEVIKGLEEEILHLTSLTDTKVPSSVESKEKELKLVSTERDQLLEEVHSLNNKLQLAYALVDENEAIALEARQVSEASKIYADQKEEEVKILEHSIEELEDTINMLEKKVYEMDQNVERHRQARDAMELELQALHQRMSTFENLRENFDSETMNDACFKDRLSWFACATPAELQEAHKQIKLLEEERAEQEREIKQYKEYISELILHADVQASQYQQKYKALETMIDEVRADSSNPTSVGPPFDKNEKCTTRTRGSSPFRCISSIVQQMNMEKDQELSIAKQRMQELDALAGSQQKEVCMLKTRLAAAENMTHDVIRDLLGVKLDITNYANFVEQHQVQKLMEAAFQHKEDLQAKDQEVEKLRKQIEDLIEEKESCIMEANRKEGDALATQIALEQLQQRDQLLCAQNEMLKVDKSNLMRRVTELDEMVKALLGTQDAKKPFQQRSNAREGSSSRVSISDLNKRLAQSEKLLNCANDELGRYRSPARTYLPDRAHGNGSRRPGSTNKDFN